MNDILQEAIAGEPVTVTLGRETYPLAYPIQAVILYKKETALLDRERVRNDGRARLTHDEKRHLRDRRGKVMAEADALRPGKGNVWHPDNFLEFELLMDEATALKIALDEDAGTGDSLYDLYNWRKISPSGDPERLLIALWIGLHASRETGEMCKPPLQHVPKRAYLPRLSRDELGTLVDLGNGGDLTMAISKALSAHLIAASETADIEIEAAPETNDPNPQPPQPTEKLPAENTILHPSFTK